QTGCTAVHTPKQRRFAQSTLYPRTVYRRQVSDDDILDVGIDLRVIDVAGEVARFRKAVVVVRDVDVGIHLRRSGLNEVLSERLAVDDRTQVFSIADQAGVGIEGISAVDQDGRSSLIGGFLASPQHNTAVNERGEADVREIVTASAVSVFAAGCPSALGVITGAKGQVHAAVDDQVILLSDDIALGGGLRQVGNQEPGLAARRQDRIRKVGQINDRDIEYPKERVVGAYFFFGLLIQGALINPA